MDLVIIAESAITSWSRSSRPPCEETRIPTEPKFSHSRMVCGEKSQLQTVISYISLKEQSWTGLSIGSLMEADREGLR